MDIKNKVKKVVMIEANDTELSVKQNTSDIMDMKNDLTEIKVNQKHVEKDLKNLDRKIEKIDMRLWAIMLLVVGSTVAHYFM